MAILRHWKLNDKQPNAIVAASVRLPSDFGTLLPTGSTTIANSVAGPGGLITRALSLNGTTNAISISGISRTAGQEVSISAWFKAAVDDSTCPICGLTANNNSQILAFTSAGPPVVDKIRVHSQTGMDFVVGEIGTTWHHLACTRNASNQWEVYLDKVRSLTGPIANANTFALQRIGQRGPSAFMNGSVADFRAYTHVLSQAEIDALYDEAFAAVSGPWVPSQEVWFA